VKVSHIHTGDESISFDVDKVGSPVLVKASYFPNWQASGAQGPWRVAPNLMVVVPTSKHVELGYHSTPIEWLGWALSLLGLVGLVLLARRGAFRFRPTPVSAAGGGGAADAEAAMAVAFGPGPDVATVAGGGNGDSGGGPGEVPGDRPGTEASKAHPDGVGGGGADEAGPTVERPPSPPA
jgi:hypothetical protein